MKGIGLVIMALSLAGCAHPSKYAYDPRAAVVGPAYLDAIAEYPRDQATEYYAPNFTIQNLEDWADPSPSAQEAPPFPKIEALLIERPPRSPLVRDLTGRGYPLLEQKGMPLFTAGYR